MELSSDQKLDRIAARLKLLALTDDEYTYYLKKDEWSEREAIMLLSVGSENVRRWHSLIESGRKSGKLKPTRYERSYYRRYDRDPYPILEYIYYYDPLVIVPWAILKEEPLPDKLIEWHDQQLKLKQTAATQLESEQSKEGIAGGLEAAHQSETAQIDKSVKTKKPPIYEQRVESFETWLKENKEKIDLKALAKEPKNLQERLIIFDNKLWNIKFESFMTEFWHEYSKELCLNRQRGQS